MLALCKFDRSQIDPQRGGRNSPEGIVKLMSPRRFCPGDRPRLLSFSKHKLPSSSP